MTKKILVVAAHPDDEILGCGGTIAAHARAGHEVHVVIMAEGLTSRSLQRDAAAQKTDLEQLADVARKANALLGAASVTLHSLPDNRMDSLDRLDVIKLVEAEIARVVPEVVYTHHAGDLNIDHRIVHESVLTACRPKPGHPVNSLLFFEVASSTEWMPPSSAPFFAPDWFVDISDTLDLKLKALACYDTEMCPWPHARSIRALESLARWRGASAGVEAAEAFMLGRRIVHLGKA
ncbi:PIG-L deacetylase family protein [Noviherbaspirillum denitrificans]|uniref:GlcNAc-PI de-N-acetylase n=1 Tax=Noviherbaspirillum denitrificans TaxID=1968433 RepID=A0A254TF76_9BURK|nr:PIG-L deacetylase family protein [Noviherbaspirillum denitrificans]OWW21309.1 GlcNAc-PI de-N-acetylase [Noviherbaspirillum denitrificans]